MRTTGLVIICIVVLGITLTLGLWPFHSPRNDVAWLESRPGLRFGRFSTVFSFGPVERTLPDAGGAIEIWLQPAFLRSSGTILALHTRDSPIQFSLRHAVTDISLQATLQDDRGHAKRAEIYVAEAFRKIQPLFLTVTSGARGTRVYIDGVPVMKTSQFPLSPQAFTGRLVLGDAPGQSNSWAGQMLGLAIYHRELTEPQVLHNYVTWKGKGRPEVIPDEGNVALYLFDERAGNVVRDKAGSGVDLHIPEKYTVVDQLFMEPVWSEFGMNKGYWSAAVKNIVGLIPFGFCFYAFMTTVLSLKRAKLVTVALGTAVSLTIELLQAYLPSRDSGTTDLITNTLGAWIGVEAYRLLVPAVARMFPWLPFTAPAKRVSPAFSPRD